MPKWTRLSLHFSLYGVKGHANTVARGGGEPGDEAIKTCFHAKFGPIVRVLLLPSNGHEIPKKSQICVHVQFTCMMAECGCERLGVNLKVVLKLSRSA